MDARSRLLSRIGNITDPNSPRPFVTLEEFFIGNGDVKSIGDERPRNWLPEECFAAFLLLREHRDVANVLVEIKHMGVPGGWPCTDTIWIVTSLARNELPSELPPEIWESFLPDDWLSYPRLDGRVTEPMPIRNGMRAQGFAYY
jgi:hypothetical protein